MSGGPRLSGGLLGRGRGLLDFSAITSPTRPQPQNNNFAPKSNEDTSVFDNLPPIGSSINQEGPKTPQPRRIFVGHNANNDSFDQPQALTPRRFINFGNAQPFGGETNGKALNNDPSNHQSDKEEFNEEVDQKENDLEHNNNSSDSQNSSMILFPPLPEDKPTNTAPLKITIPSPTANQDLILSNFKNLNQNNENIADNNVTENAMNSNILSPRHQSQAFISRSLSFNQHSQEVSTPPLYVSQAPQTYQQQSIPSALNLAQQERLNQTLPINNYQSNQITPDAKQYQDNLTQIAHRNTPADYFESSINNSLDRSFSSFKRSITREVSSAFRPSNSFDFSVFDTFLTGLVTEVTNIFEIPPSILSNDANSSNLSIMNISNTSNIMFTNSMSTSALLSNTPSSNIEQLLVKKLSQSFDENAKPIRKLLADAEVRNSQNRDKRIDDLKNLHNALNDLRIAVKNLSDSSVQELERERYDAAARRDEQQAKFRGIERRARSLKLKRSELESKLNHLKIEKESVDRLQKQMEEAHHEWEETPADSGNSITLKLQKEIEDLRNELSNDNSDQLDSLMQECYSLMSSVRDGLREEVFEMENLERWAIAKLRSPVRRPPMSRFDQPMMTQSTIGRPQPPPPLTQYYQEQLAEKRKEREANIRDVSQGFMNYSRYNPNQV